MDWFKKLHTHRYPPGLERRIWRHLPRALVDSIVIPAGLSVAARLLPPDGTAFEVARATRSVDIFALASGITAVTAVITVGIGCIVVMIMKGPAYLADGDRPATRVPSEPDDQD
jgi:hypothetical protein